MIEYVLEPMRKYGVVMLKRVYFLLLFSIGCIGCQSVFATTAVNTPREKLTAALLQQDAAEIATAAAMLHRAAGNRVGIPEVADKFIPIPKSSAYLTPVEAKLAYQGMLRFIIRAKWWKQGLDPTKLAHALREPASAISGIAGIKRLWLSDQEGSMTIAKEAGDFLLWAQGAAGAGLFPFPAVRHATRDNAFIVAERFLQHAEKNQRLSHVVKNGWVVSDEGDGGLQFDNGEAGVALLALYQLSDDKKYLAGALMAADWALTQPLVRNWNYNSFSVHLLAYAYRVTGDQKYLASAKMKALLGVIPGQLTSGKLAGRWGDAHNARPAYHYIMLRALAELALAMPAEDAQRSIVINSLAAGLKARNQDFIDRGASNKDGAMEVLIFVNRHFAEDQSFLSQSHSIVALDYLVKLVSAQTRRGLNPLGPRAMGMFLEYVSSESKVKAPKP
jgi:hypothetical protein